MCLRVRLWLSDLYVEWYLRSYLKQGYEMEFDPEIVFNQLIQCDVSSRNKTNIVLIYTWEDPFKMTLYMR